MKQNLLLISLLISSLGLASCNQEETSKSDKSQEKITTSEQKEKYRTIHFLEDTKYEYGFSLRGLDSKTDNAVCKTIKYNDKQMEPSWTLAQWWSQYNLKDGEETNENGIYQLKDKSKTFIVDTNNHYVTLGVDGSEEFETFNAVSPTTWPHLLIEQATTGTYWLKDSDIVDVGLTFTIDKSLNLRGGSQGCHAQFAWFIYIVDKNPESNGYNNFLWFGLNLFDSTKIYVQDSHQQDFAGGPGNYIYSLGNVSLFDGGVKVGKECSFSIDLKQHVGKALETAQANGFMIGSDVDDCLITGMNLGWEVFDRFDVQATIKEMHIDFKKKLEGE